MSARPPQLGLTGSIGAGKSTVARMLERRGAALVDADALARAATRDPGVLARVAADLGADLVRDGELDRAATAARVFGDDRARARLNAIVHPWVRAARAARVRELQAGDPPPLIVHDIPLLFEAGMADEFDAVAVVVAPLEERLRRVAARSGLTEAEVRERDAAQWPQEVKAARARFVLDNGGDETALARQVDAMWRELTG